MAFLATDKEKDPARELGIEKPDHAAPLRADVLGSIASADPNSPGYLGKIDKMITAHGALEKLDAPDFSGMTSDDSQAGGMHLVPPMGKPSSLMTPGPVAPPPPPPTPTTMASLNPQRRGVLGKIGHGLARMGNIAGDIFAPGVMAITPGTDLNKKLAAGQATKEKRLSDTAASEEELRAAQAEEARARAKSLENPQPKEGLTPEETTIHDLMTGENGQPRVNPETQKPYSYLEAYKAVQQAKQSVKPDKPDTETEEAQRYEKIKSAQTLNQQVSPEDLAWAQAYEKRKTLAPFATVVANAPQRATERSDKSYDRQSKRLDDARKPVDETVRRMGRLIDTLNQQSPQADALVGPELLSVMSGGAGSGLRMNEAEIARIIGGRSAWENLKASIQRWSTNPEDARSITPDQDKQIRTLIETVHQKLIKKQQILDKASDDLLDSDDTKEHRKIVTEAQKALDAVDAGETTAAAPGGSSATYVEGNDTFDIPPDKRAAFEKAHPKAKKK